jgi:excisionase family DNA binding protein
LSANNTQPAYTTVNEIAARYGVSHMTIRRMIRDGRLPAYKVGRAIRIKTVDAQRVLQRIEVA